MKTFNILFLFFFASCLTFGQSRFVEGEIINCSPDTSSTKYRPAIYLDTNIIGDIEFVSFLGNYLKYGKKYYHARKNKTVTKRKSKHVENFDMSLLILNVNSLKERIKLNDPEIRTQLFNIISSPLIGDTIKFGGSAMCYTPRNAIVFYNKDRSINTIIQFCFECWNHTIVQQGIKVGELCKE